MQCAINFLDEDRSLIIHLSFLKDLSPFTLLTIVGISGLIYYLNPDDWSVFLPIFLYLFLLTCLMPCCLMSLCI